MTHYGIIGAGSHSKNIIEDGLKDIFATGEDHTLLMACRPKASDSEKVVYNWVLDNNIPFVAVVMEGTAPKVLLETADYVSHMSGTLELIKELAANNGTLLVIWDEENSPKMEELVFTAEDLGVRVLELSNGLAPFITEDTPVEVVQERTSQEVEIAPLTPDELNDMSIGLLKKAAFAQGIADAGGMSKDQLVNVLSDTPEVASDAHAVNTNAGAHMAMIVWYQDGIMQAMPMPLERLKPLLG